MACINSRTRAQTQALTVLVLLGMVMIGLSAAAVRAHELNPTIADLELSADGTARLSLAVNLEAMIAGIGPEHDTTKTSPQAGRYNTLRALSAAALRAAFAKTEVSFIKGLGLSADDERLELETGDVQIPDVGETGVARVSRLVYTTEIAAGSAVLHWQYPAAFGPVVLRVSRAGQAAPFYAELLEPGAREQVVLAADVPGPSGGETLMRYVKLGFDHILPKGLDHVLFIVGLFLLSARMKPLLIQVTTFTLAHSVTLALGLLGFVNIPGSVVEPLIALSIVFVAVENIFTQNLHRWRTAIVFGFGLLHGLGFAGVLSELMGGSGHFAVSLIGFNIGVELGQIVVVLICYATVGYWFGQRVWYHTRIVAPASVVIALIAGYWFLERIGMVA